MIRHSDVYRGPLVSLGPLIIRPVTLWGFTYCSMHYYHGFVPANAVSLAFLSKKIMIYIYCSSLFNRLYGIVDPSNRRTFLHLHIWTIYVSQVVDRIALRKGQKPFQNCIYDIFRTWYNKQNIKENRDDVPWHEELYWYHIVLSTDRLILYFC